MKVTKVIYFLIFMLGIVGLTYKNIVYCDIYFDLGFDGQYGLLWSYALSKNLIPFKEIFYSYGIFTYYSGYNFLTNLLPYTLYLLILFCFYYFIKKIFVGKIVSLFTFFTFIFFLEKYTGMYLVNRYGVVLLFALFCAELLIHSKQTIKRLFVLGLVNGLIFGFLGDPGIYCGVVLVFTYVISVIRNRKSNNFMFLFSKSIKDLSVYLSGFVVGITPFLFYLFVTNSFSSYLQFLRDISNLLDAWKNPLTPFLNSPDNIFTFATFYISAIYLSVRIAMKKTLSIPDYFQMVILFFIFLLEQKSLVKSIDRQITFVSFFLSLILVSELTRQLRKFSIDTKFRFLYLAAFIYFVLFIYPFANRPFLQNQDESIYNSRIDTISECVEANKNSILQSSLPYSNERLNALLGAQDSFHLFPGEPVWYVLTDTMPTKYPDAYASSYRMASDYRIDSLKKAMPEFVLYNFAKFAFMDGVPDYIRAGDELKYILTNYQPARREGDSLLMRKAYPGSDFFKSEIVENDSQIADKLLHVALGNIPRSEGFYKLKHGDRRTWTAIKDSRMKVSINSQNSILLVHNNSSGDEFSSLIVETEGGLQTKIEFMNCNEKEVCAINLDRIPLFYISRQINSIVFDPKNHNSFEIIQNDKALGFW